jgi:23S rRNA pseudouridine1911/1915/1917 synthase
MQQFFNVHLTIPDICNQLRLDQAISHLLPEYSRSRIQQWIKCGYVTISGEKLSQRSKVVAGQMVTVNAIFDEPNLFPPQSIELTVVYEDNDLIIINKPVGLVTHPGAGNPNNTLLNALLYHYPELSQVPRAGIIHRLDKNTTGVMVVARNLQSHNRLVTMFQKREIKREYLALVHGRVVSGGTITTALGRNRQNPLLMVVQEQGKIAITHHRVIERFTKHTYLRIFLETGRTHQIRVHLSHLGFPIIGDPDYGGVKKVSHVLPETLRNIIENFSHQALHATKLEFCHPVTGELVFWEVPPPEDFEQLLRSLEEQGIC